MLVDTNVLSELARSKPDPAVLSWAAGVYDLALSVITLEELRFGVRVRGSQRLMRWLARLSETAAVLPVSVEIAERAADLRAARRRSGKPVTQADMLIAATAAVHGLALATRSTRDFEGLGVDLVDPFRA